MKRGLILAALLLLTGCSQPVWETVDDEMPLVPAAVWQDTAYEIALGLPEGVTLREETADAKFYAGEELEVETSRFLTSGAESAVRALSGYEADELTILQTTRFGLPEYQFAWVSQTEQGSRLYRADMVLDGMDCYAVVCSRPESAGDTLDPEIRQVFSSFGLFTDEGV